MSDNSSSGSAPNGASVGGVRVRIFGRTDVGMIREHNEDNFLIADLTQNIRSMRPEVRTHVVGERGTLFAVCDGMGGAAAGEIASKMAVDTVHEVMQGGPPITTRDQFAQRVQQSICEAGSRIFLSAKSNRAQRGMGTTSTVAGVFQKTLFFGQVGDSRAYLFRDGRIKQITKDQSLVSKLIEAGQLTEEEAETYEHAHIILQALGTADTVTVDLSYMDIRQGDALLLCSDGLSGLITSEAMREVLATIDEPVDACKRLTDLANEAGGHDNITVIVARFDGDVPPMGDEDKVFGYQPYVITTPVEDEQMGRAAGRIKGADAPPPGKDVKHAASMRPPAMSPTAPAAMTPGPTSSSEDPPRASVRPVNGSSDDSMGDIAAAEQPKSGRVALVVFLFAVALGVLATAALVYYRKSEASRAAAAVSASAASATASASAAAASASASAASATPSGGTELAPLEAPSASASASAASAAPSGSGSSGAPSTP